MNTFNWKDVDWSIVKAGDILIDQRGNPTYVLDIRVRDKHKDYQISPEFGIEVVEYAVHFDSLTIPGAGYSFTCDKEGNVIERYQDQFNQLKNNPRYRYAGVVEYSRRWNEPAVIRCTNTIKVRRGTKVATYEECGNEVVLDMVMTNTCSRCKADYNSSGSRLAPRSQWGYDTGETASEILASDVSINSFLTEDEARMNGL